MLMAVILVGCSSDPVKPPPPSPPPPPPPQQAILRFLGAYEQKKTWEYQGMFTNDFTFEFSNSTDPDLVQKFATGWYKSDEFESSTHLFQGYTPAGQPYAPAASSIDFTFKTTLPVDDNAGGFLDPVTHKILSTRVDGRVVIPPTPPAVDATMFLIENNFISLYLVRGDEASLSPGQPADSTHWYIYRWVDLSQPIVLSPTRRAPSSTGPLTWSALKASYR